MNNSLPSALFVAQFDGRWLWTRQEFWRAHELGFFASDDRLELLKGEIFQLERISPRRAASLYLVDRYLRQTWSPEYMVRPRMPLSVNAEDVTDTDVAVVRGAPDDFVREHPDSAELVIQISDTTLAKDLHLKASIYAEANIPEYWIVNLVDRVLEAHRQPAALAGEPLGFGYRSITRHSEDESIAPLAAPDAVITVREILPNP